MTFHELAVCDEQKEYGRYCHGASEARKHTTLYLPVLN
jgi:hypothetical protein